MPHARQLDRVRCLPLARILSVALCAIVVTTAAHAQYTLHQQPGMVTSDDGRRVPIPPRDHSKDPILVLRGGTLLDGTGRPAAANAVVVIQGDRIIDVGPAASVRVPANAERVVDVSGLYVVPGLIDLHIHFRQQRGDDFQLYRDSDAAAAIRGVEKLGQLLDGGITAVRDVGTRNDVALAIKEAVERRIFPGPRVLWSGRMITIRGGHTDELTETASGRPRPIETGPGTRIATGPYDWRLAVREQIRAGADWIKLAGPYTKDEVAAAIDEAHMLGIRVTVDAFGEYVTWAAAAGIDCIEHPLAISDAGIAAMKKAGTAFVPTLTAFYNPLTYGYPSADIPPGGFYYTMSRRFTMTHEGNLEVVRKAHGAGLRIGVGTDIPFENERRYPGDYFTELGMLKDAGLSDAEVFASATSVGADIMGMADKLGTLEKGKLADVLVVAKNPLENVQHLREMRMVVADGRVVRDRLSEAGPGGSPRPPIR